MAQTKAAKAAAEKKATAAADAEATAAEEAQGGEPDGSDESDDIQGMMDGAAADRTDPAPTQDPDPETVDPEPTPKPEDDGVDQAALEHQADIELAAKIYAEEADGPMGARYRMMCLEMAARDGGSSAQVIGRAVRNVQLYQPFIFAGQARMGTIDKKSSGLLPKSTRRQEPAAAADKAAPVE